MASLVIHMAVANEINKKINRDFSKLLLGTIAPDISKFIGENKKNTHFSKEENNNIPIMDDFMNKYKKYLNDDFVMGYYIHLYTDYLWFKYFIDDIDYSNVITTIDGDKVLCDRETFLKYIYNDYTNINISLIDRYGLNLKILYNDIPDIEPIISEFPMDKIKIIIDKSGSIIMDSKLNKAYIFDIENVVSFIDLAIKIILSDIEKL